METQARYIWVGFCTLLLLAVSAIFILWLANDDAGSETKRYIVRFTSEVNGLARGGSVRYLGLPVGRILEVALDPTRFDTVQAVIEVRADTPVRESTVATLTRSGLAGRPFIQLTGSFPDSPALQPSLTSDTSYPAIPSRPGGVNALIARAPDVVEQAREMLARINTLLEDENRDHISSILSNMADLTQSLTQASEELRQGIASTRRIISESTEISQHLNDTLEQARVTLMKIDDTFSETSALLKGTRPHIESFMAHGLPEIENLITESRRFTLRLNRISLQFERDPARFLFGDAQQGGTGR